MKKRVIGIVGPTASGKTALSLPVAQRLRGEIVCMDSMQIYRGMDIGTAKPTPAERAAVPHHMVDFLDPREAYSVNQYAQDARECIERVDVPILVGGTGMYLQSLSLPMDYGAVGGSEEIRQKYHRLADDQGPQAVHDLLKKVDPLSAARLHPNDLRRVIRALEVFDLTGVPLSSQKMPGIEDAPYDFQLYAIDLPRDILYARVEKRVDDMMAQGLLREVKALVDAGVAPDAQAMQGLGYKEMLPVLSGDMALPDAVNLLKMRTRHYAKRQLTWFKRDTRIRWFPLWPGDDLAPLIDEICQSYRKGNAHGTA
ncbi:MAG: tRNA (adenosine(37)-N6)-dimethylallyltransferase MiaA [Clostridia bacterium]|nr:tRNA (adenosine(37)-N6)-dimethylallyltransferase MiaA [Clostridia bacterium]